MSELAIASGWAFGCRKFYVTENLVGDGGLTKETQRTLVETLISSLKYHNCIAMWFPAFEALLDLETNKEVTATARNMESGPLFLETFLFYADKKLIAAAGAAPAAAAAVAGEARDVSHALSGGISLV